MTLLTSRNINRIEKLTEVFKSNSISKNILLYDEVYDLFEQIYDEPLICDNLRGTFLELVTHNFLKQKYDTPNNYFESALDCHVVLFGKKCKRTVDVFALCNQMGFVGECKISHRNLEAHDIATLNRLYNDSFRRLSPYIITLAPQKFIEEKLIELAKEDSTNVYVHLADIKVVSIDNLSTFFS